MQNVLKRKNMYFSFQIMRFIPFLFILIFFRCPFGKPQKKILVAVPLKGEFTNFDIVSKLST